MDFMQDELHKELQQMHREFAEGEGKPLAARIDREERFPAETVAKMAEMNLLGILFIYNYKAIAEVPRRA